MMEKRSNMNQKAILITFVGMLTIGTIGSVFSPKKEYSSTEKRKLQTFPKFSVKNLVDGKFEQDKKDLRLNMRGSSNQRIIDVKETIKSKKVVEIAN